MIWIVFVLVWVVVLCSYYNSHFRWRVGNMAKWLQEQHPLIEKEPDYEEEANRVINTDLPQLKLWLNQSVNFMLYMVVVQAINIIIFFMLLVKDSSEELNTSAAIGNAAVIVFVRMLRQRRYQAEGMCQGAQAILEAIDIQKNNNEIESNNEPPTPDRKN